MRFRNISLFCQNADEGTAIDMTVPGAGDMLALFYLDTLQAANNGVNNHFSRVVSFAVRDGASGIKQGCVHCYDRNGRTTSESDSSSRDDRFVVERRVGVTISDWEITDWITDGVRMFIHSTDGTRRNGMWAIFADDNPDLKAIDIGFHNLVAGAQSVAVGFQPDWVLMGSANLALTNSDKASGGELTQGMAFNGDTVGQGSIGRNCPTGLSTVSIAGVVSNDRALYLPTFGGALGWTAEVTGFNGTGFDINGVEGGLTLGVQMLWFAVQYTDNNKPKMAFIEHTLPNAVGPETVGGVGFEPAHFFWLGMESVGTGYNNPATTGVVAYHVHTQAADSSGPDGNLARVTSSSMQAGATTTNGKSRQAGSVIHIDPNGIEARFADNPEFTPDGWSWNWTTVLSTTEVNLGVAMVIGYPTKLYKGGDKVQEMYIGGDKVAAAYKGTERVY